MAVGFPLDGLKICEPPSAGNSSPAMKWPTCFIPVLPDCAVMRSRALPPRPARSSLPHQDHHLDNLSILTDRTKKDPAHPYRKTHLPTQSRRWSIIPHLILYLP